MENGEHGKTHFWNNKIKKKIESETENMRKEVQKKFGKSSEKVLKMVDTHGSV